MQKFCKKVISCLLVFAMCFSLIPVSEGIHLEKKVAAATDPSAYPSTKIVDTTIIQDVDLLNALKRIIGNNNLTFGELKSYSGVIDLSNDTKISSVKGLGYAINASKIDLSKLSKVKTIEKDEFQSCNFTTFLLPPAVTEINSGAFRYCAKLTTIQFPSTLTKIGSQAFDGCTVLDNITLPDNIEKIGNSAFSTCKALKKIVIPAGINATSENSADDSANGIGTNVFYGCESLEDVTIGSGMTAIPVGFLQGTKALKHIVIPSVIMSIRENAFYGSGLLSIDLSNNTNLSVISKGAFASCSYLNTVKLPLSIEKIEDNGFANCVSITNSSFLEPLVNLKEIGAYAFKCLGAAKLIIPGNVEKLGEGAFFNSAMRTVEMKDYLSASTSNRVKNIGVQAFKDCLLLEEFKFPLVYENDERTSINIGANAFENCVKLDNLRFPANLKSIGDYAFKNCAESYTDWEKYGDDYIGDRGTSYYVLPENVSETYVSGWTYVELCSDDIESFYKMKYGYVNTSENFYLYRPGNSVPNHDKYVQVVFHTDDIYGPKIHHQFVTGISSVDLTVTKDLKLGKGVFYGCCNLDEVWLPSDLHKIPNETFAYTATPIRTSLGSSYPSLKSTMAELDWYYGLRTVHMSDDVTTIGDKAFQNSYQFCLNGKLPSALKKIGEEAFANCESIGELTMPANIERIERAAFSGCSRDIDYQLVEGRGLSSLDMRSASKIGYIGSEAFSDCSFQHFQMNNEAPLVQILEKTFDNCQWVETISLSDKVEYVDSKSFRACGRLEKLDITDACTLDDDVCYGLIGTISEKRYSNLKYFDIYDTSSQKYRTYIGVNTFAITIRELTSHLTARQNTPFVLPLKTAVVSAYNEIEEVKIGDNVFTFKADGTPEVPILNSPLQPQVITQTYTYTDTADDREYSCDLLRGTVVSDKASENNAVDVQIYMPLLIDPDVGHAIVISSASYTVDVTANPCKSINTETEYYLDHSSSSGMTITPEFVPTFNDSEITDLITWELKSGNDYLTMEVVDNGKSVKLISKKQGFGSAVLSVKAGSITKQFTVHVVAPINYMSLDHNEIDMIVSATDSLVVTPYFPYDYQDYKDRYPDKVVFSSDAPDVVQVSDVQVIDGKPQCKITAVAPGKAVITAKSLAGQRTASCTVNVTTKNLKVQFSDPEGNPVEANSTISLYGRESKTLNYAFSEEVNSKDVVVEYDNDEIARGSIDSYNQRIEFFGRNTGSTKVTVYPKIGTKKDNGTTFTINCYGEVNSITLSKKTIPLGNTDSVFTGMSNNFYQMISKASEADYKSITDNDIVFESSNPEYVSVDKYGNVTVNKLTPNLEPVTITCSAYKNGELIKSESTTVTPDKARAKDVVFSGTTTIGIGKTGVIKFSTVPSDTEYRSARISTSNGDFTLYTYEFDENTLTLKIKGKEKGSAVFTLSLMNQDYEVITKDVKVTIGTVGAKSNVTKKKTLKRVTQSKPKAGKKKVIVRWKKVAGAAGYQVQMSKKQKKGFKTIATIKSGSRTRFIKKKLKRKKKYYFRVRAFAYNGKSKYYGAWSKVKKAKVK